MGQMIWCLSIGGLDATSGAGLLSDHRIFSRSDLQHAVLLTANTIQNTQALAQVIPVDVETIDQQFQLLLDDFGEPSVIKCSLLPSEKHLLWLCDQCKKFPNAKLIVDPILLTGKGDRLSALHQFDHFNQLLSLCDLLTPNLNEAQLLFPEMNLSQITKQYDCAILLTDMHPTDLQTITQKLFFKDQTHLFLTKRFLGTYHGSGCKLSSYLALGYVKKMNLLQNIQQAIELTASDLKKSHWRGQAQIISN